MSLKEISVAKAKGRPMLTWVGKKPLILQRLNKEAGVFRAEISDWRAVVDCVLIDMDHDGKVFKVALADVPERKQDFVIGHYELPAPRSGTTMAIKIIDMLGEECLVSEACP